MNERREKVHYPLLILNLYHGIKTKSKFLLLVASLILIGRSPFAYFVVQVKLQTIICLNGF